MLHLFRYLNLKTSRIRVIPGSAFQPLRQINFTGRESARLIVSVPIPITVPKITHQLGRCISQIERHGTRLILFDEPSHLVKGVVDRIAFCGNREVHNRLGNSQFSFRRSQTLIDFGCFKRKLCAAGIRKTDILDRHADYPAGNIPGIASAIQHPGEPIKSRVRIRAAD